MMDSNVQGILYERFNKRVKSAMSRRKARKQAKKIGIKIGKEKKARETAFEMLKDGLSLDKIAHYVKMPLEWVQNLKDNPTIS
ncbi:MAG: hypothetical protein FWG64_11520 [Firmicutes bacterium]|nr:hypothetical protein [Bacillota bacterium]